MSDRRNPVMAFFGWLIMAVGALIFLAAGACTVAFNVAGASQTDPGGVVSLLLMSLAFAAIPLAIGAGLVVLGWLMARPGSKGR